MEKLYRNKTQAMVYVEKNGQLVRVPAGSTISLPVAQGNKYLDVMTPFEQEAPKEEILIDTAPDSPPLTVVEEKEEEVAKEIEVEKEEVDDETEEEVAEEDEPVAEEKVEESDETEESEEDDQPEEAEGSDEEELAATETDEAGLTIDDLTKSEIKDKLTDIGIDFNSGSNKSKLFELLKSSL